jgi:hypothetical protein
MGVPPQPHDPNQHPYGPGQQRPVHVQQVGRSVTKPAWTVGDILWIVFTGGLAWPIIWVKRRARTTVTWHR